MTASLADFVVSSTSLEYLQVPITASVNPTSDAVSLAFPLPGDEPVTFHTGSWTTISGVYYAQCLIGPTSSVVLDVGYYDVYVRIDATIEVPVLRSGLLEVT